MNNEQFLVNSNQIIFFLAYSVDLNLFLSKQLTINKSTLLDCTNTEILMNTVYTYSTRLRFGIPYTCSFGTDTHKWRLRPLLNYDKPLLFGFHYSTKLPEYKLFQKQAQLLHHTAQILFSPGKHILVLKIQFSIWFSKNNIKKNNFNI